MIWDRWDDAMDDSSDSQREIEREIEGLKKKLKQYDVEIPEMEVPEKSDFGDSEGHPHRMYLNELYKEDALENYRDRLQELLNEIHGETRE